MEFPKRLAHPEYSDLEKREETLWSWDGTYEDTDELAAAGFFHTFEDDDLVCFCCGGGVMDWKHYDDPWEVHAFWFGKCEFLSYMKGSDYAKSIQNLKKN
jgi:baculoviral IAP repeat-containing protein 7/8